MVATTVLHGCDQSGATTERPSNAPDGFCFFDTTLNKPVFRDNVNSVWVDSLGGSVASASAVTILPTAWRTWDALAVNLPGTGANDDLALVTGTPGTDGPTIQSADPGGTSVTAKAGLLFAMPDGYVAGTPVTLRLHAGVLTSVADDSCTLDVSAYEITEAGAAGDDLCTTAAPDMNSTTFADLDFTITPTGLVAGDLLSIVITIAAVDAGNAAAIVPEISKASVLYNVAAA